VFGIDGEPIAVEDGVAPDLALTRFANACIAGSLSRKDARIGGAIKIDE
jgi:hypothetical protein